MEKFSELIYDDSRNEMYIFFYSNSILKHGREVSSAMFMAIVCSTQLDVLCNATCRLTCNNNLRLCVDRDQNARFR